MENAGLLCGRTVKQSLSLKDSKEVHLIRMKPSVNFWREDQVDADNVFHENCSNYLNIKCGKLDLTG